jgi:hypothetical protein
MIEANAISSIIGEKIPQMLSAAGIAFTDQPACGALSDTFNHYSSNIITLFIEYLNQKWNSIIPFRNQSDVTSHAIAEITAIHYSAIRLFIEEISTSENFEVRSSRKIPCTLAMGYTHGIVQFYASAIDKWKEIDKIPPKNRKHKKKRMNRPYNFKDINFN